MRQCLCGSLNSFEMNKKRLDKNNKPIIAGYSVLFVIAEPEFAT